MVSVLGRRGRMARTYRKLRVNMFRPRVLVPVGATAALAVVLLVYASPQTIYLHAVAVEIGGDLVGAIIVVAILTPLIALRVVDDVDDADDLLRDTLTRSFIEKYGSPGQQFLYLESASPIPPQRRGETGQLT